MALGYSEKLGVPHITPTEFADTVNQQGVLLLDVREDEELLLTKINDAYHVPLGNLEANIENLKNEHLDTKIVVICRSGIRSAMATEYMLECGFKNVINLDGGILELAKIDSSIAIY